MAKAKDQITGESLDVNDEYKDRLFKFVFGNPEHKDWTLSLYNAVNGTSHTDISTLDYTTVEDVVYMNMKNDVSFLIDFAMNLYEQQSTYNPNMPIRFLIYAGLIYSKYAQTQGRFHIYGTKRQDLPTPKCVCFYNGEKDATDKTILKLSDSFLPGVKYDIEVTVTMININAGHNAELLQKCRPLNDYSEFVALVRKYVKEMKNLEKAIERAINELPEDSVLKPFLLANKAEVKLMCITEYDEERTLRLTFEEGKEEGREEGREEGIEIGEDRGELKTLIGLVKDGLISLSAAAKRRNMTEAEFAALPGMQKA